MSKNIKVRKRKFDTSSMQNDKECSSAEVEQIEDTILEEELKAEKKKIDDMKKQIECPVCHEVPRTGPIFACPNGHLVCEKCKRESCPTCNLQLRLLKEFCMIVRIMNVMTNFLINSSIKVFDILMFEFAISCKLNLPYFWNQLQTFGCLFSQLNILHMFFFFFF